MQTRDEHQRPTPTPTLTLTLTQAELKANETAAAVLVRWEILVYKLLPQRFAALSTFSMRVSDYAHHHRRRP